MQSMNSLINAIGKRVINVSHVGDAIMAFYQLYLVTESKMQLLLYLLDRRVSFSMFLLMFASQNGSS